MDARSSVCEVTDSPEGSTTRRLSRRVVGSTGGKGAEAFSVSSFARLARTHAMSAGGDALVAIALADSLFFSIDPNDARWRVGLYLILTMAPFAVVAPVLGPAMDRVKGGHRFMMIASAGSRSVLALVMAFNVQSLFLFPLAFSMLVLGKSHHIAKSAMVPGMVKDEEGLVKANSRLSVISALAGGLFGIPGVILLKVGGSPWTLGLASIVFAGGVVLGLKIPATKVANAPAGEEEKSELRGSGIVLAASAMGYVRGVVGFLTMLLAFELRGGIDPGPTAVGLEIGHQVRNALGQARIELASGGAPTWYFGLVLLAMGLGGLAGALASPHVRRVVSEERILAGVLGGVAIVGTLAALIGGLIGAMLVAFAVSLAGQMGKQAFDAIVQRDAPEANLGRSFSRFESRFQLVWVIGALIPVIVPLPARLGFLFVALASAFAAVSYWLGRDPASSQNASKERFGDVASVVRRRRRRSAPSDGANGGDNGGPGEPDVVRVPVPASVPSATDHGLSGQPSADPPPPRAEPTQEYTFPPFDPPTSPPTR